MEWNGIGFVLKDRKVYELKNGKGFVQEYYSDNKIKYEGEYLYGERNGKGK